MTRTGCPLMVIDTSAIVAIAFNEPGAESFEHRVADASIRLISAATVLKPRWGSRPGSVVGQLELRVWAESGPRFSLQTVRKLDAALPTKICDFFCSARPQAAKFGLRLMCRIPGRDAHF